MLLRKAKLRTLGQRKLVFASNLCSVQCQQSPCTYIPAFGDARAKAQYLLNTISADVLRMTDVLQSTKPAKGGLRGGGLCEFDA